MAAVQISEQLMNELIAGIINDIEYPAGISVTKPHDVLDSLNEGLSRSRLTPAWHRSIDDTLKLILGETMAQVVSTVEVILKVRSKIIPMFGVYTRMLIIRRIREYGDCGLVDALRVYAYLEAEVNK